MFFVFPFLIHRSQKKIPYFTLSVVLINVALFVMLLFAKNIEAIYRAWGFLPNGNAWFTWLTYMFLHASPPPLINVSHLLGNMIIFIIFGSLLEDVLGAKKLAAVYFASGLVAALFFLIINIIFAPSATNIPMIGASGAIFGLLGIAMLRFKKNKISFCYGFWLIFPLFFSTFTVSAFWAILFYFGEQLILGFIQIQSGAVAGTAYWGHIGGFLAGLVAVHFLNLSKEAEVEFDEAKAGSTSKMGSFRLSAEQYDRLIDQQPNNPEFYSQAAQNWALSDNEEKAVSYYRKALDLYILKGQAEPASQVCSMLQEFYPNYLFDAKILLKISNLCLKQHKYETSMQSLQKLIANYPDAKEAEIAYLRLAQVYEKMGNFELAQKSYQQFIEKFPASQWLEIAQGCIK
ncbi:MAG: rhomboid family intramembrane serine protease [Actinobacteria bacterium]|nr:MAG: rhomboid family intramembrane serine protease [Actinomycetota bacterium]